MESGSDCKQGYHSSWFKVGHPGLFAGTWNHKSVLQPILRDGHGACHRARIRATRWRPPQDEVSLVETQQPHAEERATRASRSMGGKRQVLRRASPLLSIRHISRAIPTWPEKRA